jgi:multidrug efflux system membrane fusion protein
VPVTAVRRGAQGDFVYVVRDDRTVEQRPVQRGLADDRQVQIERGVAVGERVVTEGGDRLRDGARVQLPEPAASAASGASGASGPRGERRRGTRPEA